MNYSDYWVVSDDGITAQVHHAPFRPATHYTLILEARLRAGQRADAEQVDVLE